MNKKIKKTWHDSLYVFLTQFLVLLLETDIWMLQKHNREWMSF